MNPTAELADIVLPGHHARSRPRHCGSASSSARRRSRSSSSAARSSRRAARRARTCRSSSTWRPGSGSGEHFFDGDIEAAFRHQLAPSGITLEQLRAHPAGIRVPLTTRHRKYAERDPGVPHADAARSSCTPRPSPSTATPAAGVRRAGDQPALPARPRRALPAGAHLREVAVVLRDPAPAGRRPAQERARPADRDAPRHRRGPRHRRRRLGAARRRPDGSVRARAQAEHEPRPGGRRAASTAGGRPAPSSGCPATRRTGRTAPTSTSSCARRPSDPVSGSSPLRASVCEVRPLP